MITLARVIEIIEMKEHANISDEEGEAVANMAIEAIKRYAQARRLGLPLHCDELLPGETK